MKETLYFPKLNLTFNLSKIATSFGPIKIYWYGIIITLGFILGYMYVGIMSKKFALKMEEIIDIIFGSVVGGIIGARIYYVAFNFDMYKENIGDIFKIWEGGIAIYGGIIGAFLVGVMLCKKKKVNMWAVSDLGVGGLILGQSIGRWGNFINIEAFGKNTESVLGMTSISIQRYLYQIAPKLAKEGIKINPIGNVHPCFLYESIWCMLGFLVIMIVTIKRDYWSKHISKCKKKEIYPGELTLLYFIWYGLGRFFIEGLRVDSLMIGSFRISRVLSLILVVICSALMLLGFLIRYKDGKRSKKSLFVEGNLKQYN